MFSLPSVLRRSGAPAERHCPQAVSSEVEDRLIEKGVLLTLINRGLIVTLRGDEDLYEDPRLLGRDLGEFFDLDADFEDLRDAAEEWGDDLFEYRLLRAHAAGRTPPPAEAVDIYLAHEPDEVEALP